MLEKTKKIILFDAVILALLVIGTRVATALHEIIGHGLPTILYGGNFHGFYMTFFGGGFAYTEGDEFFLPLFGGIVLNIAMGIAALCVILAAKRLRMHAYIALLIFAGVNLVGGLEYAVTSSYYRYGDAFDAETVLGRTDMFWLPAVFLIMLASLVFLKIYADFVSACFNTDKPFRKILYTAATLGISLVAYGILMVTIPEPLAQADARPVHRKEVVQQIKEDKKVQLELERLQEIMQRISKGEKVPEELVEPIDAGKIEVSESEVKEAMPFPIEAVLLAIYLASLVTAAFMKRRIVLQDEIKGGITYKTAAVFAVIGILTLAVIFLAKGNFGSPVR